MFLSLESLAALATIIGTVVGILALIQSGTWLAVCSLLVVCLSICAVLYGRRQRLVLQAASTVIEGYSIDSLNMANMRRKVNQTFVIQDVHHTARIEGKDLEIRWKYSGYCRAKRETAMSFSIDSDTNTSFESLNCIAFDLGHDPEMKHQIRPLLIGAEGISKKISVPFLEPLKANQSFGVLLKCVLPRCITPGIGYYTSTLSFSQRHVRRSEVRLIFADTPPTWLRVYESTPQKPATLVKTLVPIRQEPGHSEYVDVVEERAGQSARVYIFLREAT